MAATPQALSLPATTSLHDCIVVGLSSKNTPGAGALSFSGAGAQWTYYSGPASGNQNCGLAIGIAANPGQTTITCTGTVNADGCFTIGIFSGIQPYQNPAAHAISSAISSNGVASTTPSMSYSVGDLLVGTADSFANFASGNASWSDGSSNAYIDKTSLDRDTWTSYAIAVGSSGTYTTAVPNSGQGCSAICVALTPGNGGGNFLPFLVT
jgi:hypothetical protein